MPIIATATESKTFTPAPEGTHQAVCVDVIDKGMQPNTFKPGTMQHKIDLVWQIAELRDDGKRYQVYKRYNPQPEREGVAAARPRKLARQAIHHR
jgi:hypothetical protein